MSEEELAKNFIAYFDGYEIYPEVPAMGIIDFMAIAGNVRTAVEVKTSFNLKVIEQAVKNRNYAHFSYIAVPFSKDTYFRERLCKDYGVGVLEFKVDKFSNEISVREKVKPKLQRKISKVKLEEYMKRSVAGSQHTRITAFGNTVEEMAQFLKRNSGRVSIKRVMQDVKHHYSSNTSARQCIINMCRSGVIKQFRHENGFLILN